MQRRFTPIQGGLIKHWGATGSKALRERGWRIERGRPGAVDQATFTASRRLAEMQPLPDPFAHPDFFLTAARHGGRGTELVFAFAFEPERDGQKVLSGVLPLVMPHPVWGRSARLWQPTMVPSPIEPLFQIGAISGSIKALLRYLVSVHAPAELHLDGVAAAGRLQRDLYASDRLRVDARINRIPIPPGLIPTALAC